jgi:hypothetical protein
LTDVGFGSVEKYAAFEQTCPVHLHFYDEMASGFVAAAHIDYGIAQFGYVGQQLACLILDACNGLFERQEAVD